MHLAVNGYFWNRPNTGSGQYTRQLVYQLNRLVSDLDITLVFPQGAGEGEPTEVPPSVKVVCVPMGRGHLGKVRFEQVDFPRVCGRVGATLAHVPYWGPPLRSPVPLVVTVHDLTTLLFREYRRRAAARLYTALVSAAARGAGHVITDSEASRHDIIEHLGIGEKGVTAIYLGVGPEYKPQDNFLLDMAVRKKYGLPDEYVLYLGGYEIHKNVTMLLLAYTYVRQGLGEDYPLLLAGRKPERRSAHFPDYDGYIEQLGIKEQVRWLGFVEEGDKPVVYRGAGVFAFPSLYEGFGLPVLEAMACGVPVVGSDAASLPEVIGDAGYAIDPEDARQFAGSIIAAATEPGLAAELKRRGVVQAAKFTWEKTATQTLLVYDGVLGGGG